MATAKRKQEELGGDDGDCSEPMDSDSESIDLESPSGRKRCRMDDDMRQQLIPNPVTKSTITTGMVTVLDGIRYRFAQNN